MFMGLLVSLGVFAQSPPLMAAISEVERGRISARQLSLGEAEINGAYEVKVRLRRQVDELTLSAVGLSISASGGELGLALQNSEQLTFGLGAEPQQWWVRRISAEGLRQMEVRAEWLELSALTVRLGAEPLPQKLRLWPNPRGGIDVIAHLDLDSYLAGVLPSEMPASWPRQALKAQAVAARSYMLSVMGERLGQHFHLESTVEDQVYSLAQQLNTEPELQSRLAQVLKATRGEVLADIQGDVLRAFYHADCGGHTEEARLVWGRGPRGGAYPRGAGTTSDPYCPSSPLAQWRVRIARQELEQKLGAYFARPPEQRRFVDLVAAETTGSGRVSWINVLYPDQGRLHSISSQELRRLLGFGRVRSTRMTWQWVQSQESGEGTGTGAGAGAGAGAVAEQLEIQGRGHGHGVGLCQWGARALAERGLGYRDILRHYYPQATLANHAQ